MKCPECGNELKTVHLYSERRHFLDLKPDGTRDGEPYPDQMAEDHERDIECPHCQTDLTHVIGIEI